MRVNDMHQKPFVKNILVLTKLIATCIFFATNTVWATPEKDSLLKQDHTHELVVQQKYTNALLERREKSALWRTAPLFTSLFGVAAIARVISTSEDCTWDFCYAAHVSFVVCCVVGTTGMINVLSNCLAFHRLTRAHNTGQNAYRIN